MTTVSRTDLKRWTDSQRLDLIGVASIDGYRDVEAQWHPASILPTARSVVVFGRSIPRSYYRGVEEGTVWTRVNRWLPPKPGYYLCRIFEDNGALAVPVSLMSADRWPDGVVYREGKPAPNVSPDVYFAAQLAGLGEIGYHGLLITPQFGVRQALGMLITDAEIKPDEPFPAGTLCEGEDCLACVAACPSGGLSREPETRMVGSRTVPVAKVRRETCAFCVNGAFPDTSYAMALPNRMTAACVRACIAHLEDGGKVETNYRKSFRRREAWAFDTFGG